jgi:FAD/FMN-containing dehydrogenase
LEIGTEVIRRDEATRLAPLLAGRLLFPGDDGYAAACGVFNLNVRLSPALVAGVKNAVEVQAAVQLAALRGLTVTVKATGHQTGLLAEGSLLITTERMRACTIDPAARTARLEAGVTSGQVLREAARFGLAPLNGSASGVGVIGYTLGGGHSVAQGRSRGYAADYVRALEVVTADGELRRVTAEREPDLFWAMRGGKGNFGVVTALECDLFPLARLYGGGVWFPLDRMPAVWPAWCDWAPTLPELACTSLAVQRLPALPQLPEPLRGASVLHLRFTHLGPADEGQQLLAPMRALGPALMDTVGEMPYSSIDLVHMDPVDPLPYWDWGAMLRELPGAAREAFLSLTGPGSGCPLTSVEVRALGGALDRPPAVPNAVNTRGLPYVAFAFSVGGPGDEARLREALVRVFDGLAPWSAEACLVNFLAPDQGTTRDQLRRVYGPDRYDRLARIKQARDPRRLFRTGHDIV